MMIDTMDLVDLEYLSPEDENNEFFSADKEVNTVQTEDAAFELEEGDFDGDIAAKFVEPNPLINTIVNKASSGWYIQNMFPSIYSKNKTKAKGCGKGTFQGSYGYALNKCLKYYEKTTFLYAQYYECNSTYLKTYLYADDSCTSLKHYNISRIHCTQKCSSFGGYPRYNGSQYRLQVGQVSTTNCRGDKTFYYIEMANVCQYDSYNQSHRIVYPHEFDYNNYNCNGFGPARLGTTTNYVPSGNLTYGCIQRPDSFSFPTEKYVSFVYPGIVVSNSSSSSKQYKVHSSYPGGLTYSQILGWSLAITICFTFCCCLCIAYCIMTYCPWCLTCCAFTSEVKEKRIIFHGRVHYRQTSEKYVEKPFDPNITEPSRRQLEQRYASGEGGEIEYVNADEVDMEELEEMEEIDEVEDEESRRPVGRDTTGMNLINQFAYEDEPQQRYSGRGMDTRREYSVSDGYSYDYPQYEYDNGQQQQARYPAYTYERDYNGGYRHQSATFDAYM